MRPLAALALLSLAAPGSADTKLVYAEEGGTGVTAVLYVTDGHVRLDLPQAEDRYVVFDAASTSLRAVDPARKSYAPLDADAVARLTTQVAAASLALDTELANLPPEQRAQVERVVGRAVAGATAPAYDRTGRRMKVAGYECEVLGYAIANERGEACVATASALGMTPLEQRTLEQLRTFADKLAAEAFPAGVGERLRVSALDGVPVRAKHGDQPAQLVKTVSHDTLPGSLFAVPAEYKSEPLALTN